jgi:predicted porin
MFNLGEFSMKKTLVAMAAFAAVSSFAQSTVTLYGIADVWFGSAKGSFAGNSGLAGTPTQTLLNTGGLSGSRFGLRGSEDLGGGLKANFVMENGHNTDTGANAQGGLMFGRQTYVGMSGGFGEFRLGRQYPAYDVARGSLDTMGHTSFSATVVGGAWERVGAHYAFRTNNTILYNSPKIGGFSGSISYSLGEDKTATASASNVISLHGLYANGPITAVIGYQNEKGADTPAKAASFTFNTTTGLATAVPATPAVPGVSLRNTFIGGAYDLGVAKINAGYNAAKFSNGGNKDTEFGFGVAVPFGATTVSLGYGSAKEKANGGGTVEKGSTISLQAVHALSKRTDVYGGLVNGKVENGAGVDIEKNRLVAVGMRHRF